MWRDISWFLFAALVLLSTSGTSARPPLNSKYPITIFRIPARRPVPRNGPTPRPTAQPSPAPSGPPTREKNGIRVVLDGGNATRGRVEVSYKIPGLEVRWLPLCGVHFTDEQAQIMCQMLGYRFGRKYYSTEAVYPARPSNAGSGYSPVNLSYCDAEGGRRRRRGRSLQSLFAGEVNAPPTAPYRCYIAYAGPECPDTGPFAAVECAGRPFPPAPPPPPTPPAPPPPPVSKKDTIRLIGGRSIDASSLLEPNLCVGKAQELCQSGYSRVELLVADASGSGQEVWSPVCYPEDEQLGAKLAKLVCEQFYYYPWAKTIPWYVSSAPGPVAFPILQGDTAPGGFTPDAYTTYTSFGGSVEASTYYLQQTSLQLSSTPCDTGLMAVQCWIAVA